MLHKIIFLVTLGFVAKSAAATSVLRDLNRGKDGASMQSLAFGAE